MRDYLSIGPTPCDEDCAQVGSENYQQRALKECHSFLKQLRRQFGVEPRGAKLYIQNFPHDGRNFGEIVYYYEVVCEFDDDIPESVNYAFQCENEAWQKWDNEAKAELNLP